MIRFLRDTKENGVTRFFAYSAYFHGLPLDGDRDVEMSL
jgi:hypothetical protein